MNKDKPKWRLSGDMSREEWLINRIKAEQWKERINKRFLLIQHHEILNNHNSKRQSENAKKRKGTSGWLATTTEQIYKFNEPESFFDFLEYLIDDENVYKEKTEIINNKITSITYRPPRSNEVKTIKIKTLQTIFSKLKKAFPISR